MRSFGKLCSEIASDADRLISCTVLHATGKHFSELSAGELPPPSLLVKAYGAVAYVHVRRALTEAFTQNTRQATLHDATGQEIGHTSYRELAL